MTGEAESACMLASRGAISLRSFPLAACRLRTRSCCSLHCTHLPSAVSGRAVLNNSEITQGALISVTLAGIQQNGHEMHRPVI